MCAYSTNIMQGDVNKVIITTRLDNRTGESYYNLFCLFIASLRVTTTDRHISCAGTGFGGCMIRLNNHGIPHVYYHNLSISKKLKVKIVIIF